MRAGWDAEQLRPRARCVTLCRMPLRPSDASGPDGSWSSSHARPSRHSEAARRTSLSRAVCGPQPGPLWLWWRVRVRCAELDGRILLQAGLKLTQYLHHRVGNPTVVGADMNRDCPALPPLVARKLERLNDSCPRFRQALGSWDFAGDLRQAVAAGHILGARGRCDASSGFWP